MNYIEKARRVFEIEIEQARQIAERLDSAFEEAVGTLRDVLEKKGKIIVIGVGKSGHIGDKIAATLTSTGSLAVTLNSLNALHGDLGVVNDGDAVLALSYSGETEELLNVLPALARFDVKILAITGNRQSTLARASHIVLDVKVSQEACPLNLAPTSSTTAMLMLGDALAMVLLEARGFSREDFARFHPGGRLGRVLLLRVRDIMRGRDEMVCVRGETKVLEAVIEMKNKRAGAAVITDECGKLEGIFTHGDFVRHFPVTPDIGDRRLEELMTRGPVTIRDDKLAVEVLHVLEKHRIDDVVVVDEEGRAVGVVDSQDLSRLKIV